MKKMLVVLVTFLIGAVLLCSRTALSSTEGVTWVKHSENPVILEVERAVEPWVIFDSGVFKMWYTGITDWHRIYYTTSLDGVDWISHGLVLDVGSPGSWEAQSVQRPVVRFDGVTYRMWYLGYVPGRHQIGYATSTDGINWIKYDGNPVIGPGGNGGWDDSSLGEFTVLFNGSSYLMWYSGTNNHIQKIGVATSTDGISWTKYLHNPVLTPEPGKWDEYHVYAGPVIEKNGGYSMWYTGDQGSTARIGLATSPDGLTWTRYEENPVIDVGSPGSWDSSYVFSSTVLDRGDQLLMWYWGGSNPAGGTERIGLAISHAPCIAAEVDIDPTSLNSKSNGKWITGYVELPEGYDVADVNVLTVMLNVTVPAELSPTAVGDYDSDGVPDLMVKFSRAAVQQYIPDNGPTEARFTTAALTMTGELNDGTLFQASDTIRIIFPMNYWKIIYLEKLGMSPT